MARADLGDLIVGEHRAIDEILALLATERQDRFGLAHRLIDELAAHIGAGQQVLYPALRDVVPGGIEMAADAQRGHRRIRVALEALAGSHPGEPGFEDALVVVTAEVAAHVPVEEGSVGPALRTVIGSDKMAELGGIYAQVKEAIPSGLQGFAPDMPTPRFRAW